MKSRISRIPIHLDGHLFPSESGFPRVSLDSRLTGRASESFHTQGSFQKEKGQLEKCASKGSVSNGGDYSWKRYLWRLVGPLLLSSRQVRGFHKDQLDPYLLWALVPKTCRYNPQVMVL